MVCFFPQLHAFCLRAVEDGKFEIETPLRIEQESLTHWASITLRLGLGLHTQGFKYVKELACYFSPTIVACIRHLPGIYFSTRALSSHY